MTNYDPHDWKSHLLDIRGSMIREIFGRVLTCVLWALIVVLVQQEICRPNGWSLAIPETGHALVGVALGLLLVFRTNASYDRFWEGRKQWGSIVNECRNLGRTASIYLRDRPELVRTLLAWTSAFPWAVMYRLRGGGGAPGRVAELVPPDEARQVMAEGHFPLAIARRMTALIAEGRRDGLISDYVQVALDRNILLLVDYLGACERIHNTPMPFAYMVHLRRALILYCFTLPFALLDRYGWGTMFGVLLIAYLVYGIEEIGVEIEDPFGEDENDLPLEQICETIEKNLSDIARTV